MSADQPAIDALWDANDVARFFKVSRSWVYLRIANNEIPFTRKFGVVRFEAEKIRAWARGEMGEGASITVIGRGR